MLVIIENWTVVAELIAAVLAILVLAYTLHIARKDRGNFRVLLESYDRKIDALEKRLRDLGSQG